MSFSEAVSLSKPSHLCLKRNIYYFRFVLNGDLRQYLGCSEIRISLRTAYVREASDRSKQLYCLLKTILKERPVLTYSEIKTRLNRLLAALVENQAQRLEALRVQPFPADDITFTRQTLAEMRQVIFKDKLLQQTMYDALQGRKGLPDPNGEPFQSSMFFEACADSYKELLLKDDYFTPEEFADNRAVIGKCLQQLELQA